MKHLIAVKKISATLTPGVAFARPDSHARTLVALGLASYADGQTLDEGDRRVAVSVPTRRGRRGPRAAETA